MNKKEKIKEYYIPVTYYQLIASFAYIIFNENIGMISSESFVYQTYKDRHTLKKILTDYNFKMSTCEELTRDYCKQLYAKQYHHSGWGTGYWVFNDKFEIIRFEIVEVSA